MKTISEEIINKLATQECILNPSKDTLAALRECSKKSNFSIDNINPKALDSACQKLAGYVAVNERSGQMIEWQEVKCILNEVFTSKPENQKQDVYNEPSIEMPTIRKELVDSIKNANHYNAEQEKVGTTKSLSTNFHQKPSTKNNNKKIKKNKSIFGIIRKTFTAIIVILYPEKDIMTKKIIQQKNK